LASIFENEFLKAFTKLPTPKRGGKIGRPL